MARRSTTGKKVFIAGLASHDYEPAKDFGDLVIVVSGSVDLDDTDDLRERVESAMATAEPGDYVLLSGAPIICLLCSLHQLDRWGFVQVLQWNGVERSYVSHRLEREEALK